MIYAVACRKPALLLKPQLQTGSSSSFRIRLIPTITQDTFSLAKLTPDRNNLRLATSAAPTATAAAYPATAAAAGANSSAKVQKKRKRAEADSDLPAVEGRMAGQAEAAAATRLPTPQYNTSIIADMMVGEHQQVLQSAFEAVPRLPEAVVLLKVDKLT